VRLPVHPWAGKWIFGLICFSAAGFTASRIFHDSFAAAGLFFFLILSFFLCFFRNPSRRIDERPETLVSPADGRILEVCRESTGAFNGEERLRVSIFLALWNVHVIRSPLDATVISRRTTGVSFYPAFSKKSGLTNHSISLCLYKAGMELNMRLSAGFIARRIHCEILEGNRIGKGEIIGLIRFGSRVDLILPASVTLTVRSGTFVKAGTVIGFIHEDKTRLHYSQPVHSA